MQKYHVYIIHSTEDHFYIGQTNNLEDRLERHNSNRSKSTKNKGKWELVITKEFTNRSDVMKMEKKLKKMKNCKKAIEYLQKLV
ncbi:MAG: GIY-YIG nuclease family protein [Chlorobi bacterium]|nr:GIY-YIG nuclease family protein [Chlorobiota bacterium]